MSSLRELNLDGLIGPTHHFGGLGVGNKASEESQRRASNPRAAALEGLQKMRLVSSLGITQLYLPPPARPAWGWLENLGFTGHRQGVLARCAEASPTLLSAAYSSAFMWTANAASMSAATDTIDACMHLKVANLSANLHRSIESEERYQQLCSLLANVPGVCVHSALLGCAPLRDEGAANGMRLCSLTGNDGCYVFVYGSDDGPSELQQSRRRPPRQSKLASQLVAQSLQLPSDRCFFVQQTPEAIDAGVFHNDVIATSHENLLLYHEQAFVDGDSFINQLSEQFSARTKETLLAIQIHASELSLAEAVNTYLFNSQIVTDPDGGWRMICPSACEASDSVQSFLARLQRTVPRLKQIDYVHLQQSMANGGGPACLRLRVILDEEQIRQLPKSSIVTEDVAHRLQSIIEAEYPTHVTMSDLIRLDFALHAEHIANQIAHVWQP